MQCPSCGKDLIMSERQGIEIDFCLGCRGVWLDRGELDKIIERSSAPPPQSAPTAQSPWDDDRRGLTHPGRRHKRRKSFLEELFD